VRNKTKGATMSLDRGEICGFMHWSDLQIKFTQNGELFGFADALDELVNRGWKCVLVRDNREKHPLTP
jgi:hypothetical protein